MTAKEQYLELYEKVKLLQQNLEIYINNKEFDSSCTFTEYAGTKDKMEFDIYFLLNKLDRIWWKLSEEERQEIWDLTMPFKN